jgi:predicted PurR-regulated permease PerM
MMKLPAWLGSLRSQVAKSSAVSIRSGDGLAVAADDRRSGNAVERTDRTGAPAAHAVDVRTAQAQAAETRDAEAHAAEMRDAQAHAAEMRDAEARALELHSAEERAADDRASRVRDAVPVAVEIAGQWSWRILAIVGVLVVGGLAIVTLKEIVIPLLVAILISALLVPIVQFLERQGWPKWAGVVVALVGAIVVVGGLVILVESQVRSGLPGLEKQFETGYDNFRQLLRTSPLKLSDADVTKYVGDATAAIQKDRSAIFSGALSIGSTATHLLTGFLLVLFSTIFLLIDGAGVWSWVVRLFPRRARVAVDGAGHAGWHTLTTFVRVQIFVAAVDAIGVGLFAFFLGLPLVVPIAILVFLASFIPVVGAIATGVVAVLVALVFVGPVQALIMLGGVLVVHLLEAHVLQPLVMGNAVRIHPLAVVLAVGAGTFLAGIPGALFAVPTVAVINVMITFIARGRWRTEGVEKAADAAAADVVPTT